MQKEGNQHDFTYSDALRAVHIASCLLLLAKFKGRGV